MHQPRPYGYFGPELDALGEMEVRHLLLNLTNVKQQSGLESLKLTRAMQGGGSVTALDMGGVVKVFVTPPAVDEAKAPESDGVAQLNIPMMFSGAITRSKFFEGGKTGLHITPTTQRRLSGYSANWRSVPSRLDLQRFIIGYGAPSKILEHLTVAGKQTVTQYELLRPTWFSGSMATVVQIVSGIGRQFTDEEKSKLDRSSPSARYEDAQMVVDDKVLEKVAYELGNVRLPGYTGLPPADGEVKFAWMHHSSNGVTFADDGKPWLLEISNRGIYAMPLPLVPATTTRAFREYIESVNDTEMLWILDKFGGIPSGEAFPVASQERSAWERAGVIVRMGDTSDFYTHLSYSTAFGWSFSENGRSACNTCFDFDPNEGLAYGMLYEFFPRIGPTTFDGRLPESWGNLPSYKGDQLSAYLELLYRYSDASPGVIRALKYKLRRVPVDDILSRANAPASSVDAEFEYWSKLELVPIANARGSVHQTRKDWLFWSGVKVPEPALEEVAVVTIPDKPQQKWYDKNVDPPKRDTVVFAYYIGNDMHVVKHFGDPSRPEDHIEGEIPDDIYVGRAEKTEYMGGLEVAGDTYLTHIDERRKVAPTEKTTVFNGKDAGYGVNVYQLDTLIDYGNLLVTRSRYADTRVEVTTKRDGGIRTTATIPYFCRDAAIYTSDNNTGSILFEATEGYKRLQDPNYFHGVGYGWMGLGYGRAHEHNHRATGIRHKTPDKPGGPPPQRPEQEIWVTEWEAPPPGLSGNWADQGPFLSVPSIVTSAVHYFNEHFWTYFATSSHPTIEQWPPDAPFHPYIYLGTEEAVLKPNESKKNLYLSTFHRLWKVTDKFSPMYFSPSPDIQTGVYFYTDAIKNVAGRVAYASIDIKNKSGQREHNGTTIVADHTKPHYFIGVINE